VVYRGKPLMPMRWGRVNKYLKLGKGVLKYGKLGILYFKLTSKPTTLQTQEMVLGIDLGASYDGFSVVSKYLHHDNINTEHTRDIKKRMAKRALFRRFGTIKKGKSNSKVPTGESKYSVFTGGRLICYRKQKVEIVLSPSLEIASSQFIPPINWRVSL